jgi:hypothetical protein
MLRSSRLDKELSDVKDKSLMVWGDREGA